jgi:small basic protein (TIGR04137 family)
MSMDKSLKSQGELTRHRNVLSRAERVERLMDDERWDEDQDVFGLPKVANRRVQTRKKAAQKEAAAEEAEALAEGEEAAPEEQEASS